MKMRPPETWGRECLTDLPNDQRYLVGVSGGRDSVVLLHWLLGRGYRRLIVCHFEHGLRGRASKAEAHFVERLAGQAGLEFELGSADVQRLAKKKKQSIETTARQERLNFFTRVARRRRCPTIFLAHQADDQVETFLLNLFRGAAGRGLGAMRPRSQFGSLAVVRPLLGVWRREIDAYQLEHDLSFCDDPSNAELVARRNRLRHRIIPWLEKELGRNIRPTIWRAATVMAEEEDFLASLAPASLTTNEKLALKPLRALAPALQRRVIRQWLASQAIAGVGFDAIEAVRSLLAPDGSAKVNLARGRHVRRRSGSIFLE